MRQDPLIEQYPVRIRGVIITVLLTLSVTFYAFPRFLGEPQKLDNNIVDDDDLIFDFTEITKPKMKPKPKRPSYPIGVDEEIDNPIDKIDKIFLGDDEIFEDWQTLRNAEMPPIIFILHDEPPRPLTSINPVYPEMEYLAGLPGSVIIDYFVDENGRVTDIFMSDGDERLGFGKAAIKAIKNTRFEPAMQRDKPVGIWMRQRIVFNID